MDNYAVIYNLIIEWLPYMPIIFYSSCALIGFTILFVFFKILCRKKKKKKNKSEKKQQQRLLSQKSQ